MTSAAPRGSVQGGPLRRNPFSAHFAARWSGPLAIALAFAALVAWSFRKWADPVIDFGAELYVPWRLAQGEVLYRDLAFRHGPLSPHLNALWFVLFGVSIDSLVRCNLALIAVLCALTYGLFRRACDRLTATTTCLTLLAVFAFAQYLPIGNYNYVTPYQHSQTHGLILSVALVAALGRSIRTGASGGWALAGLCLGLVLLTKIELQLPALATSGVAAALLVASRPPGASRALRLGLAFAGGAALPALVSFALLRWHMPAALALEGLLGNWAHLTTSLSAPFYLVGAGLDAPWHNASRAGRMFAGIALFALLAAAADRLLARRAAREGPWAAGIGVVAFALLVAQRERLPWFDLARALPLTSLAAAVAAIGLCLRGRSQPERVGRWAPLALWSTLSLFLLGKIALAARFHHYGFALAMPATLLLVAVLVGIVPGWLRRGRRGGRLARALALAAVGAGVVFCLEQTHDWYARKTVRIGRGGDAILAAGARGRVLAAALARLERTLPPAATLLVLPEGAGLNYWLRRENPSRYHLFVPPELDAFGEGEMLADVRRRPPDFVVLVDRPHAEFGVGPFGVDPRNGRALMEWVGAHYERSGRIGAEPFRGRGFGVAVLRRRPAEAGPGRAR